jgi:hypothetical protein
MRDLQNEFETTLEELPRHVRLALFSIGHGNDLLDDIMASHKAIELKIKKLIELNEILKRQKNDKENLHHETQQFRTAI